MGDPNCDGKTGLEQDEQPLNLSDSPLSAQLTAEYRIEDHSTNGKNKYKNLLISDLKMEREARENGSKVRSCYDCQWIFKLVMKVTKKYLYKKWRPLSLEAQEWVTKKSPTIDTVCPCSMNRIDFRYSSEWNGSFLMQSGRFLYMESLDLTCLTYIILLLCLWEFVELRCESLALRTLFGL